jgi:hypothetical protein
VVEVDRRESESKGCGVFYPFGLAPPSVDTYVLWCVDRGRHKLLQQLHCNNLNCVILRFSLIYISYDYNNLRNLIDIILNESFAQVN